MAKAAFFEHLASTTRVAPPGHCGPVFVNGFSGGGGGSISYGTGGGAGGGGIAQYEQDVVILTPTSASTIVVGPGGAGTGDFNGGTGQNDYSWDGVSSQYNAWKFVNRTQGSYDDDARAGGGGAQNGGSSHYGVAGEGNAVNPANGGGGAAGNPTSINGSTGNSSAYYGGGAGGAHGGGTGCIYGAGGGGGGGVRGPGGAGADAKKSGFFGYGVSAGANTGAGGGAGTQAAGGDGGSGYLTTVDVPHGGVSLSFTSSIATQFWTPPPGYNAPVLLSTLDSQGLTTTALVVVAANTTYQISFPSGSNGPQTGSFGGDTSFTAWNGNATSQLTRMSVTFWPGIIAHTVLQVSGTQAWWKSPPGNSGPVLLYNKAGTSRFKYGSSEEVVFGLLQQPYASQPTFNGVMSTKVGANTLISYYTPTTGSIIVAWFP